MIATYGSQGGNVFHAYTAKISRGEGIASHRWIDPEWIEHLLWCPSQCYRRIEYCGRLYTLYLRWRYEDPWQFMIAEGDMLGGRGFYVLDPRRGTSGEVTGTEEGKLITESVRWRFVSDDLFERFGYHFRDEEYREAERKAEELFFAWMEERCGLSRGFNRPPSNA
ncbi:MAG: hypothetical protein QI223_08545 [Candidatus Korarchaeota archaeon]|nr:hypothetical protein [Candidatus Korarchaeota archaeon]